MRIRQTWSGTMMYSTRNIDDLQKCATALGTPSRLAQHRIIAIGGGCKLVVHGSSTGTSGRRSPCTTRGYATSHYGCCRRQRSAWRSGALAGPNRTLTATRGDRRRRALHSGRSSQWSCAPLFAQGDVRNHGLQVRGPADGAGLLRVHFAVGGPLPQVRRVHITLSRL